MARHKNDFVIPGRVRQARLARGKSMQEVAYAIGVSRQMISKYELGLSAPTPEALWKLRDALEMPVEFFTKDIPTTDTASPLFFRSLKSSTTQIKMMVEKRLEWIDEIITYLSDYLEFPAPNLPDMKPFHDIVDWTDDDIEQLAYWTRQSWGLGFGPISDVTLLVENNGIFVSRVSFNDHRVDACSQIRNQRPIILLGNDQVSASRARFDVAHELGHLLLHSDLDATDIDNAKLDNIEQQAHRFARAFLLPQTTFEKEVVRPTLANLQVLKSRWKVSIKMMIGRLRDLDIVDEKTTTSLYKQYNAKRWSKSEPLDADMPVEKTNTLSQAINLLVEHKVKSLGMLLDDITLPATELEQLLGLEQGALTTLESPGVSLKLVK